MVSSVSLLKQLLVGRPVRSDRLQHTLLPKRIALPVFASDPMSSVAYAPAEIMLTLSIGGLTAYAFTPWVALVVVLVLLTVVASYRQNVRAYTSGGGDYEVATVNLGGRFGLTVASALLVDYVLTVAVSVASGINNLASAVPFVAEHRVALAVAVVVALTGMNLRGVRESGLAFAIPTYLFIAVVLGMVGYGLLRILVLGHEVRAESAGFELRTEHAVTGFAFVFLLVRAFSSGCAALTGVEAIANGVPAFRPPKGRNAATTLLILGVVAASMFLGIILLARYTGLVYAEDPATQLAGAPAGYQQKTVTAQLADAVFSGSTAALVLVTAVTALILFLAANTAYNGFPVLGSILAQDRYLPRQLYTRGDRLAFSNGIVFLAGFATVLIVAFNASETRLIQLYIVGVFVSFTLSQTGMIRHWNQLLRTERDPARRRAMLRSRTVNGFGAMMTGFVLVLVLATKFTQGAWISIAAMAVIYLTMRGIRRHYGQVARELAPRADRPMPPSRNHAIVLISRLHQPTIRALAYARATRPDTLAAVTVNLDEDDTRALVREWERRGIPVPLTVIDAPYREITRPVLDHVNAIQRRQPGELVTVFVPEYVLGHWWEQLLHNQSTLRLKARLRYEPGVVVTSVPWQLAYTQTRNRPGQPRPDRPGEGDRAG
ncbi:MAG: amino acid permease [Micromonosporaceae bacterium]|nr:amino acid permease [Micromonosporaceae bacterium]